MALAFSLAVHAALLGALLASRPPRTLPTIDIALHGAVGSGRGDPREGATPGPGSGGSDEKDDGEIEDEVANEGDEAVDEKVAAVPPSSPFLASRPEPKPSVSSRTATQTNRSGVNHAATERTPARATSPPRSRGGGTGGGGSSGRGGAGGTGDGLRASCVACPSPIYPMRARRRGWQGVVDIALRVDGQGRVAETSVARSSGHRVLDEAAAAAARRSRFRLAPDVSISGGSGTMRYRFELDG